MHNISSNRPRFPAASRGSAATPVAESAFPTAGILSGRELRQIVADLIG